MSRFFSRRVLEPLEDTGHFLWSFLKTLALTALVIGGYCAYMALTWLALIKFGPLGLFIAVAVAVALTLTISGAGL
jgi:Mg/Co/Ni transporter MgtE